MRVLIKNSIIEKRIIIFFLLLFLIQNIFCQELIGPKLKLSLGVQSRLIGTNVYRANIFNGNWGYRLSFDQNNSNTDIFSIYSDPDGRNRLGTADIYSRNFLAIISNYIKENGAKNDQEWTIRADAIATKIAVYIQTMLFLEASAGGNLDRVKKSINAGIGVNAYNPDNGWTALMYASRYGQLAIVRFLIAQNANANWKGPVDDWTPLLLASSGGYTDIVEILLDKGADATAITSENNEEISFFSSLIFACRRSDIRMAEMLIKKGANVNYYTRNSYSLYGAFTPLNEACRTGNVELVRLLIQRGANVNYENGNYTPLRTTLERGGNEQIAILLIQNGANPNVFTFSGNLLIAAAERNYIQLAELLLNKGFNVNYQLDNRDTAIHIASGHGFLDMVQMLIKNGANPNLRDSRGHTALGRAKHFRKPNVVLWLTGQGAQE